MASWDDNVKIVLPRENWAELCRALRAFPPPGLQLGRLAWMVVAHIEGRVAGVPEQYDHGFDWVPPPEKMADADGAKWQRMPGYNVPAPPVQPPPCTPPCHGG